MSPLPLSFAVDRIPSPTGVRGWVTATFDGEVLELRGDGGGALDLPLAAIDRVRIGYEENKFVGRVYQLLIWSGDNPAPLPLRTLGRDGYGAAARALAAALSQAKGINRVERGVTMGAALALMFWFTPFLLVSLWGAWAVTSTDPAWASLIILVVPGALFTWLGWRFWTWQRPRPIRDLAELDQQLPPG
jgi:hypothetical protein